MTLFLLELIFLILNGFYFSPLLYPTHSVLFSMEIFRCLSTWCGNLSKVEKHVELKGVRRMRVATNKSAISLILHLEKDVSYTSIQTSISVVQSINS
jgi:hypothetical protein